MRRKAQTILGRWCDFKGRAFAPQVCREAQEGIGLAIVASWTSALRRWSRERIVACSEREQPRHIGRYCHRGSSPDLWIPSASRLSACSAFSAAYSPKPGTPTGGGRMALRADGAGCPTLPHLARSPGAPEGHRVSQRSGLDVPEWRKYCVGSSLCRVRHVCLGKEPGNRRHGLRAPTRSGRTAYAPAPQARRPNRAPPQSPRFIARGPHALREPPLRSTRPALQRTGHPFRNLL